ncbi:uncharacterized protein LOC128875728 [Hylaeus volcanicus]|uniref:uncharacterized protein LOC128875728 n=1 Tax=Hylaeus volcanicus TaxID=313075 RepID=UPI0023B84C35|nr:uncharacterized protein LOC128875728 [Hylaeus volcanicus]
MITVSAIITSELNTSLLQNSNDYQHNETEIYVIDPSRTEKYMTRDYSVSIVQTIIFFLFVCGIFFAIVMYCKVCSSICRASELSYNEHSVCQSTRTCANVDYDSMRCFTIVESSELRDTPPSYNEACSVPPLYGLSSNRIVVPEAPPVYSETPKPEDRVCQPTNPGFSVAHHV